jgi:hypothetical protein
LYTIPATNNVVSNHAALRQFFPLEKGDGVVHTFDVLHGVDVDPKLNCSRTSLIVWLTDHGNNVKSKDDSTTTRDSPQQPWLQNPSNHVQEFILALASECNHDQTPDNHKDEDRVTMTKNSVDPLSLSISSASQGNIFAMTQLGQMCDDEVVPPNNLENIQYLLENLDPTNPFLPKATWNPTVEQSKIMARALWYHAAIHGGNRVAQISLADEIMLEYMSQKKGAILCNTPSTSNQQMEEDADRLLLMASTLFTMALFQGYDSSDALFRIMDIICQRLRNRGVEVPSEAFFENAVVKTLLLSL